MSVLSTLNLKTVSFSLWMVLVEVLGQSITNVFVFYIILVAFLDPVGSRLAGLPVVDIRLNRRGHKNFNSLLNILPVIG